MNDNEIQKLLDMLLQATRDNKLNWEKEFVNGIEGFKTSIDGCKVILLCTYNPMEECWEGHLELYNPNGALFFSGIYPRNTHLYDYIYNIVLIINDILLQITQSKNRIFNGLERIIYG